VLAVAMVLWGAAEIVNEALYAQSADPPVPSAADVLWLAFYPACCVALTLMLRRRAAEFRASLWADGAIGALAAATVGAAFVAPAVLAGVGGTPAEVGVNLAYPLGDLLLLATVVGVFAVGGWRPGRRWLLVGLGFLVVCVADGIYLVKASAGTYLDGTLLDTMWPLSALLLAAGAWSSERVVARARLGAPSMLAAPLAGTGAAATVLALGIHGGVQPVAAGLAIATLVAASLRTALTVRENIAAARQLERLAYTDPLTGLGNRRRLSEDLRERLAVTGDGGSAALILYDLDGFKVYNDTFGHPAGDALLARLGRRLSAAACLRGGAAYRLGGDEFCVVLPVSGADPNGVSAELAHALREHGESFRIGASWGALTIPDEAAELSLALRLADERLYQAKRGSRRSAAQQAHDALVQALSERGHDLHRHGHGVVSLSRAVAERLGLDPVAVAEVARAAELHDVGKIAIPDEILYKPGPLDASEWEVMKTHTIAGERIVAAAPALEGVARIVRASHERIDGGGYPDGLREEEIPLGARIILACDAFQAMSEDRPYRAALSGEAARRELERAAGSQFDPRVVGALLEIVGADDSDGPTATAAAAAVPTPHA
jgi:diguanylate cyclase (GGDEF)-like protein